MRARLARASAPPVGDELGAIFDDAKFADLFPKRGQPGLPTSPLALASLLQSLEGLPTGRPRRRCAPASTGSTCSG